MWEECHIAGRWVKVPAEELEWSLAPGSGGLSGLPTEEKQPEGGLQRTERFIHHVQSLHRSNTAGRGGGTTAGEPASRGASTAYAGTSASSAAATMAREGWSATSAGASWRTTCGRSGRAAQSERRDEDSASGQQLIRLFATNPHYTCSGSFRTRK